MKLVQDTHWAGKYSFATSQVTRSSYLFRRFHHTFKSTWISIWNSKCRRSQLCLHLDAQTRHIRIPQPKMTCKLQMSTEVEKNGFEPVTWIQAAPSFVLKPCLKSRLPAPWCGVEEQSIQGSGSVTDLIGDHVYAIWRRLKHVWVSWRLHIESSRQDAEETC